MPILVTSGVTTSSGVTFSNLLPASGTVTASVSPSTASVNEGSGLTFNVTTTNIANGTTLYWTIANTSTTNADFSSVSGSFNISANAGSFTVTPLSDSTTEGAETFTLQIRTTSITGAVIATSSSVIVNDTSTPPIPTYAFGTIPASINEGSTGTFNVNTTNVANGTTLYWTIYNATTTTNADFSTTSGSFNINSNAGSFTISPTADLTTEGNETFLVQVRTTSITGLVVATSSSVIINDTSLTPPVITATITPSAGAVYRGNSLQFVVESTGATSNTTLFWRINHQNTDFSDFNGTSGSFQAWNNGVNNGIFTVSTKPPVGSQITGQFTVSVSQVSSYSTAYTIATSQTISIIS